MRFLTLYLGLEDWTAKRALNILKRLKIGEIVEFLKTHLESLVGSAEAKGSVSIIKSGSSTQVRGTTRYRKTFTKMESPGTPRTLKEKFLRLNYYNIIIKMLKINQKRVSRIAERAPKNEKMK